MKSGPIPPCSMLILDRPTDADRSQPQRALRRYPGGTRHRPRCCQGEIVALVGANGAGKTTVARAIAGLLPYQGEIAFEDETLKPNSAERNLARGIALVPEGRGILARMSVEENLLMGLYIRTDKAQGALDLAAMFERFPILSQRRDVFASLLSGGEQQMLAIARALLSRPRLLLLDEPSLGLAPKMTGFVFQMIRACGAKGSPSCWSSKRPARP